MTPTHQAALNVTRDSIAMLRDTLAGLPDEAMDWSPAPGVMNSLGVLIAHSLTSTKFLLAAGCGQVGSLTEYRTAERTPAFATSGLTAAELGRRLDGAIEAVEPLLNAGTQEHLEAWVTWPEDPSLARSGAQCLVHATAHLREHVGHAQALHDLWVAGAGR